MKRPNRGLSPTARAAMLWATRNDPKSIGSLHERQNLILAWLESKGHVVDWRWP